MLVVYHYPKCTTCKKALKWLDDRNIAYEARHIVENTPSAEDFERYFAQTSLPLRRFFNTSGMVYREGNYKDRVATMSNQEAAKELASNGMLVKRPLVVGDGVLLVGFRESVWEKALLPSS